MNETEMSDLQGQVMKLLRQNDGLSVEEIQLQLQKRVTTKKANVPEWVVRFALNSLRAKGWVVEDGNSWRVRRGKS